MMSTISWFIHKALLKINQLFYTALLRTYLYVISIPISKPKFYGKTSVYKFPGSKIIFGSNNRFRSTNFSNPVGVSRKNSFATITGTARLEVGDYCGFSGVAISCAKEIIIGKHVMCGANTVITDTDWHNVSPQKRKKNTPGESGSVFVGNNVWIGMDVMILKGAHIGDNTVIGAKSLVTGMIPANCIAAGVPCKVIKQN